MQVGGLNPLMPVLDDRAAQKRCPNECHVRHPRNADRTLRPISFHELPERGVDIRTLDDPLAIDTAADGAMSRVGVARLRLFAEMERVYMLERTERARAAALTGGVSLGPKMKLSADDLEHAVYLRDVKGLSMAEISDKTGVSVATLYRRMPPRPVRPPEEQWSDPDHLPDSSGKQSGD